MILQPPRVAISLLQPISALEATKTWNKQMDALVKQGIVVSAVLAVTARIEVTKEVRDLFGSLYNDITGHPKLNSCLHQL